MCLALAKTIEVILDDCLFVLHPVLYWGGGVELSVPAVNVRRDAQIGTLLKVSQCVHVHL